MVYVVLYKLSVYCITIQKKEKRNIRQNKNPEGNLQPIRPVNSLQDLIPCLRFPIGMILFS